MRPPVRGGTSPCEPGRGFLQSTRDYVQNSHPAIIDPDGFDAAQAEMALRKGMGRPCKSASPFSTEIVCGDCRGTCSGSTASPSGVGISIESLNKQLCNARIKLSSGICNLYTGNEGLSIHAGISQGYSGDRVADHDLDRAFPDEISEKSVKQNQRRVSYVTDRTSRGWVLCKKICAANPSGCVFQSKVQR